MTSSPGADDAGPRGWEDVRGSYVGDVGAGPEATFWLVGSDLFGQVRAAARPSVAFVVGDQVQVVDRRGRALFTSPLPTLTIDLESAGRVRLTAADGSKKTLYFEARFLDGAVNSRLRAQVPSTARPAPGSGADGFTAFDPFPRPAAVGQDLQAFIGLLEAGGARVLDPQPYRPGWAMRHVLGAPAPLARIALLGLGVALPFLVVCAVVTTHGDRDFVAHSVPVSATVVQAGDVRSRGNTQRLTVTTDATAPGGARQYEARVDLGGLDSSVARPIRVGAKLDARVRTDRPELRVAADDLYQGGFFIFISIFFAVLWTIAAVYVVVRTWRDTARRGRPD